MPKRPWIDTGHLNSDSGAVGGGKVEVKRNDALADEVERLCRVQGWAVGKTNENDAHTSLTERISDARRHRADMLVSIHHDWVKGEQAVIYSNTNDSRETRGRRLAGFINRRIDKKDDGIPNGGIYADRRGLTVLHAVMPAVIIEASRVQDPYIVKKMAEWIVRGMCDYYGLAFVGDGPKIIGHEWPASTQTHKYKTTYKPGTPLREHVAPGSQVLIRIPYNKLVMGYEGCSDPEQVKLHYTVYHNNVAVERYYGYAYRKNLRSA